LKPKIVFVNGNRVSIAIDLGKKGENNAVSKQTIHLLHPTDSAETTVDHGHVSIQYLSSTMCP